MSEYRRFSSIAAFGTALTALPVLAQQARSLHPATVAETPAQARADALAAELMTDEKLIYVHGYFPPFSKDKPTDVIPSAGYVPGIPRLGIPTLRESDASIGVANQVEQRKGDVAPALPASLALAADYNPARPGWHVAAGRYTIAVGRFAGDRTLSGVATLVERRLRP